MVPYVFILYMGIMAQLILLIECRNGKLASGEDQLVMLWQRPSASSISMSYCFCELFSRLFQLVKYFYVYLFLRIKVWGQGPKQTSSLLDRMLMIGCWLSDSAFYMKSLWLIQFGGFPTCILPAEQTSFPHFFKSGFSCFGCQLTSYVNVTVFV